MVTGLIKFAGIATISCFRWPSSGQQQGRRRLFALVKAGAGYRWPPLPFRCWPSSGKVSDGKSLWQCSYRLDARPALGHLCGHHYEILWQWLPFRCWACAGPSLGPALIKYLWQWLPFRCWAEGSNSAAGRACDSSFQPAVAELGSSHRLAWDTVSLGST